MNNQELELKVIELDLSKKRIILSLKQLTENPWEVLDLKAGDDDYDDTEEIMKIFDRYLPPRYAQAMKLYYGADETTALSLLKVVP